jgi:hypothetical protein
VRTNHNAWIIHNTARIPDAVTHPGFRYKCSSLLLGESLLEKPKKYSLPYITKVGHISNCIQYRWTCKPTQLVSTLIATVYSRLMRTLLIRHGKKSFKLGHLMLRCSAYYVFTKNDYFLNRVLGVLGCKPSQRRKTIVNKCLRFYVAKLDDNTRFVLRQVWQQANWLSSRVERPRDKSAIGTKGKHSTLSVFTHGYVQPSPQSKADILRQVARCATTFWMSTKDLFVRPCPLGSPSEGGSIF